MALIYKNGRVINIAPPKTLTKEQRKEMENAPINEELIKRALSRNFKVIIGEWNGSKKLKIKSNGLTEDGKIVLSGYSVFRYIDSKGVPLENILMTLDRNKYVIDWLDFISTSVEHKWKLKGTLTKIEKSILEIYGKEYSLIIMKELNYRCREFIDYL